MITDKLKELTQLRAKAAALESEIAAEQSKELGGLPAQYGFESVDDFIAAIRTAAGEGKGKHGRRLGKPKAVQSARSTSGRRRARITDETRAEVKKLVEGGKTGSEIAQALKISLPSVQNIKKALGLVRKRKK